MQPTNIRSSAENSELELATRQPPSTFRRVGSYAVFRLLTISITIIVGIFIAVVVANKGGGIDTSTAASLRVIAQRQVWNMDANLTYEERRAVEDEIFAELADEAGLNEPFLKKHLLWTVNALKLDLGDAIYMRQRATYVLPQQRDEIKSIIFDRLPNTLALVGLADLLVFVVGIPLALYLSRNYGNWIDKLINVLSPLSSVPSWVHGFLLILVFAVTLKMLPPGGMIDIPIPDTRQAYLASRLKHMILPVLAIFLSLLFQLVYTWRNYFMIYSNEDYVEFAVARGLTNSEIQNKYILRPSLPYVLTGFALTLVSFWQMATALEIVFNWDGIGSLYIVSLPNYWGETMFPGEMGLTIGIVVVFAYLLGMVVFLLDIAYALVDPRIRLGGEQQRIQPIRVKRRFKPFEWVRTFSSNRTPTINPAERTPSAGSQAIALTRRPWLRMVLILLLLLLIGVVLGLALGWVVWPIQYTDASPADLASSYQVDYIQMVVDSFTANHDSQLAHRRLDALGEHAASAMETLVQAIGSNSSAKNALVAFAVEYDPAASGANATDTSVPLSSWEIILRIVTLLLMIAGGAAVIGGTIWLYLKIVNQPEKRSQPIPSKSREISLREEDSTSLSPVQRRISRLVHIFRQLTRYPSAVAGMVILMLMIVGSLYAVIRYPYQEIGERWYQDASDNSRYVPRTAYPTWINFFLKQDFPETIIMNSQQMPEIKTVRTLENGNPDYTITFEFDYPYQAFPTEVMLYFDTIYDNKKPFATFIWQTPDGRQFQLHNAAVDQATRYDLEKNLDHRQIADHQIQYKYQDSDVQGAPILYGLFVDPDSEFLEAVPGTYSLEIKILGFEPDTQVDVEMVLMGQVYGYAGTDFMRRDLVVPLLWGMPFALGIGMFGALLTTVVSMLFAAFGVWFGGWADNLVQRITEANMILPVVAIAVLFYAFYGASLWTILAVIVILNAFGSPTKTFRAAFIQVKQSSYIEAAQAYGAPNRRIIFRYMIPRILPVLIPQLVTLIPGFIFLEATLGMFNVKSDLPTWGKVIYEALSHGAAWGSRFWVLEPITLLLLTGFAFSMMGFALDRVLNPRLQQGD